MAGNELPGTVLDIRFHNDPPLTDLDRQLIRVWLGAEIWDEIRAAEDPETVERRLVDTANRSRFYRRWKFHLLSRCLARQVEEIVNAI